MSPDELGSRAVREGARGPVPDDERGSDLAGDAEAMRRRLALLESIVESIDGSVFSLDPEFRYTSFNQVHADAMRALYGSEVALGRSLFDCQTVEEHRRTSRGYLERALAGETVAVEAQAGDPRFVQHHTQLTHAPVRDEHGSVVGVAVSARDISDRRRVETELKEREEQLQAVIDNSPFGMHMYRLEGDDRLVFTGCNQTAGDMLGLDHASLVGLTLEEAFPGNADADTAVAYHSIARDGGRYESYEYAYDAEGISGVYEIHAFRFGPRQMAVYFRDITKRRSLELALEERERMLTTLLGNLPGMAYRCANDEAWTDEFVSAGAEELLGYSVESKLGGPAPSLTGQIHPDDLERVRRETDEAVARDEQWQYVYRITTADGVPKWVMERGVGVRDESGEVVALEGFLQDVTAQHENEERLAAAAARWRHTFDAMRDSVAVFDADGRLVSSNAATAARTGRLEEDMIGRPCHEVFHGAGGFTETCPFLQSRESHAVEETILEQAGRWSRVTFQPLLSGDGVFQGGVHVVSDITELMLTEQRLRESLSRLEVMTEGAIATIARAVEVRDPYTAGHQRRVSQLAEAIALFMGLEDDRVHGVRVAGMVHDVGKIDIPAEILSKPGRLNSMEFELIKRHSQEGHDVLSGIDFPWPVAQITLQHHERLDGSGYPGGLSGDAVLLEARIVAVADVVEAMASHRPYRAALGVEAALQEIEANGGLLYDTDVCAACLALFREEGFAFAADEGEDERD